MLINIIIKLFPSKGWRIVGKEIINEIDNAFNTGG